MKNNSEIRNLSKAQLGKIFSKNWAKIFIIYLIPVAASFLGESLKFIPFISIAVAVFTLGPLYFGQARVTVKLARGESAEVSDYFGGFNKGIGKIILLGLMTWLFIALWSLLFIVPGIIKSLSYALAPFIMQDDPDKDWKQCLDESRAMMNGYKGKLFGLYFSYVGWYILGFAGILVGLACINPLVLLLGCCVILFVSPYVLQAVANFYIDVKKNNV